MTNSTKNLSSNFLPVFYRTDANKKFNQATIDQLIQPGTVKKVSGHIGRQNSRSIVGSDIFLSAPSKERQDYQLEPGLVITDELNNTTYFKDYQDYINQLSIFGGNVSEHNRINESEFYAWNPHICWDKFVNFQNYYWLQNGPDTIRIIGDNLTNITSEFSVSVESQIDNNAYIFSTTGEFGLIRNPLIKLYKGYTYTFTFNSLESMFFIKTLRDLNSGLFEDGVVIDTSNYTLTFTVPNSAPSVLYYQNNMDIELGGAFEIQAITSSTELNVTSEILGKKTCTINNIILPSGEPLVLSNGMKLSFSGLVTPVEYSKGNYYVEGVGSSIKLVPESSIIPIPTVTNTESSIGNNNVSSITLTVTNTEQIQLGDTITSVIDNYFDENTIIVDIIDANTVKLSKAIIKSIPISTPLLFIHDANINLVSFDTIGFDTSGFDGYNNINRIPEYLLINRYSLDRNAWSRKNRWFHKDVIETSALVNNKTVSFDQTTRASRPIIEFEGNLRLFNCGNVSIGDVNLIDNITTDVFSNIEGQLGYNIDGVDLKHGHKVLFTNDSDHLVNNKIYLVEFIDVLHETQTITHTVQTLYTSTISEPGTKTLYFGENSIVTLPIGATVTGVNIPSNSIITSYTSSSITINNSLPLIASGALINITVDSYVTSKQIHLELLKEPQHLDVTMAVYGARNQGNTYWYNNNQWELAQTKTQLNQAPLFYVIDSNGVGFNDDSVYTGSQFSGTKLFSYKLGTGSDDLVLGFPLTYRNIDNTGDIVFDFNIESDTFVYKNNTSLVTQQINTGYLEKLRDSGIEYVNGWITNSLNIQPGIRIYKNENIILASNIELNHQYTIYSIDSTDFTLFGANENSIGQTFIATKSGVVTDTGSVLRHDYAVDLLDIKPEVSDISVFVNGSKLLPTQWSLIDAAVYKLVRLLVAIDPQDILTIKTYNKKINTNGYYEIPVQLQNNPLNETITNFTLGEVMDHVKTIVNNSQYFVGTYPGPSNLRDLGEVSSYGSKFITHASPFSITSYHITSQTNNIIHALEQNKDDYTKFKRNFITVAESLGVVLEPREHVDLILQEINKDKAISSQYCLSDMVPYGGAIKTDYTVVDSRITSYPLTTPFTLTKLSNKAVGVYLNNVQLCHNKDYTFNSLGFVVISTALVVDDIITVYEYDSTDGCFVPETPTKLGLWPKYEPMMYVDTSLVTPRTMIRGHDGSSILAYDDYRDNLILELELRIFNNIKIEYDTSVFDIYNYIPRYDQDSLYSLEEFNTILAPSFYKWTSLINKDYSKPYGFDRNNPVTFNYTGFGALNGEPVPGYWCGIYNWMLDTTYPNLFPWECLGFSIKPKWWEDVYGPAPYTSDNLVLWNDLANGLIKEPGKAPIETKFKRPFLINHIPVNENGNILSPLESGLVTGTVTSKIQTDFVFGDAGPVEAAWRRSSHYPFGVLHTILLMNPSIISVLLDRSRVVRNLANQLVYSSTNKPIRPQDIIFPSTSFSDTRKQTSGLINYLINYLQSDNTNIISEYEYDLQHINCKLSYRVGGFTSKEKFNLLLDSKSPNSSSGIFVPKENYDIILNSSSPVKKLTYSGVIITKLAEGFVIRGYSQSTPYFHYYPWVQSGMIINVGGISEGYSVWSEDQQYVTGKIVNYNNHYYRVKLTHRSTTVFDPQYYQLLPSLPVIGGKEASMRKRWNRNTIITIPYNTLFRTIQEVVDFLLGYGEYLKDQGFVFDEFNTNYSQIQNWETSVKEFLFWTTQNWSTGEDKWDDWLPNKEIKYGSIVRYMGDYYQAIRTIPLTELIIPDSTEGTLYYIKLEGLSTVGSSVIAISPAATKITFKTPLMVVDNIRNPFNEYEIVAVDGKPILVNFLNSYRDDMTVSYSPQSDEGIFGASFYLIQKEQVVLLDNVTVFNDVLYNTATGYRRESIRVNGYVSIDWDGSFNIPGFILDQAIIQDWEPWTDYSLGDIVKYKSFYYSANTFLSGVETFNSSNWYKLDSKPTPQLLPNWTYKASQFTDFYDLDSDNFDANQQKMAQHLIGYQKRDYLDNIIQDDVSEFKFYQGMITEKGTHNVFNKLFDALNVTTQDSVEFNEEWALRVGRYGANNAYENIEFVLDESLFKINPQGFELVPQYTQSDTIDFIIRPTPSDLYIKPIGYSSNPFPTLSTPKSYFRKCGHVRPEDVLFTMRSLDELNDKDSNNNYLYPISAFNNGDYIWCTFVGVGWDVYKYTVSDMNITNITYSNKKLVITTDKIVTLSVGSYIGLNYVIVSWGIGISYQINDKVIYDGILYVCNTAHTSTDFSTNLASDAWSVSTTSDAGFYKVVSVTNNIFEVSTTLTSFSFPSLELNSILVYEFKSQRIESIDDINDILDKKVDKNSLLWVDDHTWSTWINNPVYNESDVNIDNPKVNTRLGQALAMNTDGTILAASSGLGKIHIFDRAISTDQWIQRQILNIIPQITVPIDTFRLGTVITLSPSGDWLAVGSPTASLDSDTDHIEHGFVSVFYRGNDAVYRLNTILTGDVFVNEHFGSSLTLTENLLFIGSDNSSLNSDCGRVSLFTYTTTWDLSTFSVISRVKTKFGQSMSINDKTLLISEPGNSITRGVVHVYEYNDLIRNKLVVGIILRSPNGNKHTLTIDNMGILHVESYVADSNIIEIIATPSAHLLRGEPVYIASNNGTLFASFSTDSGTVITEYVKQFDNFIPYYIEIPGNGSSVILTSQNNVVSGVSVNDSGFILVQEANLIDYSGYTLNISAFIEVEIIDKIHSNVPDTTESFGKCISLSNDSKYIAISSILYDDIAFDQGIVYIYSLVNGSYSLYQEITSINPTPFALFGDKLAFTNNDSTLVIYSRLGDSRVPWELTDSTIFDNNSTTFLIEYGRYSGCVEVYDQYATKWIYGETLVPNPLDIDSLDQTDGYGTGFAVGENTIAIGAPFTDNKNSNILNIGRVFSYNKDFTVRSWTQKNYEINHIDLSKIKRAFLYNKSTSKLITYLDVVDSLQGKIPGISDQEIEYKTFYDPAIYSLGGDSVRVDSGTAWTKAQVGRLWWNLSTAGFVESYDSNIVFRNSTWNTLAYGASIDIYEWVETTYTPIAWIAIADTEEGLAKGISGTPLYTDSYSINKTYDNVSNTFKNTYYYWVKNKKTIPEVSFRTLSAQDVSDLIANPRGEGYVYLAITGSNSFSIINGKSLLDDTNVILSIDYWTTAVTNKNIHTQWDLFNSETSSKIPNNIELKWFDSLCGKDLNGRPVPDLSLPSKIRYGIENRPRQGMFVNPLEALKQTIEFVNTVLINYQITDSRDLSYLETYDPIPNAVRGLYDQVVETDIDLQYVSVGSFRQPSIRPNILNGRIIGIIIDDSGSNYFGNREYSSTTWYGPPITVVGSGINCAMFSEVNSRGEIVGCIITNPGEGYDDNTACLVRPYSVLVNNDFNIDGMWSIYTFYSETKVWSRTQTQSYDTRQYWRYQDWYASGYSQYSSPDYTVTSYTDLITITPAIGELVKVTTTGNGTWVLLEKYSNNSSIDYTTQYKVVGSQNGTIQFLPSLYKYGLYSIGYDASLYDDVPYDNVASVELRNIFIALRDDILIDDLKQEYLKMFMVSLRYVLNEQLYVDWAFKTSFIKAVHNVGPMEQRITYQNDNLEDYEKYVLEVKPYRTKVREYVSRYDTTEDTNVAITDFDLQPVSNGEVISTQIVNDQLVVDNVNLVQYPWKYWYDNIGYSIESIDLIENGTEYVLSPIVEISGNCRIPAKATAYLSNGRVNRIIIDNPGEGYITTPIITLNGSTTGITAKAVAKLGSSYTKSSLIRMKFDRISQTFLINQLLETETFIGTGSKRQFPLKWSPDIRIGKSTVTIDGNDVSPAAYQLSTIKSTTRGYTSYSGAITFDTPVSLDSNIVVEYNKNWDSLTAVDRIQFCYDPAIGELGKDLAQLMNGVDYGNVIIDGLDFNTSSIWGGTSYGSEVWGSIDNSYDDYIVEAIANMDSVTLPYIPEYDTNINVYHIHNVTESIIGDGIEKNFAFNHLIKQPQLSINIETIAIGNFNTVGNIALSVSSIVNVQTGDIVIADIDGSLVYQTTVTRKINSTTVKLSNILYKDIPNGTKITFVRPLTYLIDYKIISTGLIRLTYPVKLGGSLVVSGALDPIRIDDGIIYTDGISSIIDISRFNQNVLPGDLLIFRKSTSDGSIIPTDYDSSISGGQLYAYGTAAGINSADLIIDGGDFVQATAPEEVLPGNVVDTVAIKVHHTDGYSYMQFKDMLNRIHYKRLNGNKQTTLTHELKITDYTIEVLDASNFDIPNRSANKPGVVYIEGERIEYFSLDGNVLGQLRRSTLGTSAKTSYPLGTIVQDIGPSETIPYLDTNRIDNISMLGSRVINWNVLDQYILTGIILTSPNNTKYILTNTIDGVWHVEPYINDHDILVLIAVTSTHLLPGDGVYVSSYNGTVYSYTVTDLGVLETEYITHFEEFVPYYIEIPVIGGGFVLRSPSDNGCIIRVTNNGVIEIEDNIILENYPGYILPISISSLNQYDEFIDFTITENSDVIELDYIPQKVDGGWSVTENKSLVGILMRSPTDKKYILTIDSNGVFQTDSLDYNIGVPSIMATSGVLMSPGVGFNLETTNGEVYELSMSNLGVFESNYKITHAQENPFILELPNPNDGIILTNIDGISYKITVSDLGEVITTELVTLVGEVFYEIPPAVIEYGQCDEIEVFVGGYDFKQWLPNTEYVIGDYIVLNSYSYKCITNHISSSEFYKDWNNWNHFVSNTRLIKKPYSSFNINIAPDSPEGDSSLVADFMVDGISPRIKLTNALKAGTKVSVVKQTGSIWNNSVMNFIQAVPGATL